MIIKVQKMDLWHQRTFSGRNSFFLRTEGRRTNLATGEKNLELRRRGGIFYVAGKDVNFDAKTSSQVAASGLRYYHAIQNTPFVWH